MRDRSKISGKDAYAGKRVAQINQRASWLHPAALPAVSLQFLNEERQSRTSVATLTSAKNQPPGAPPPPPPDDPLPLEEPPLEDELLDELEEDEELDELELLLDDEELLDELELPPSTLNTATPV